VSLRIEGGGVLSIPKCEIGVPFDIGFGYVPFGIVHFILARDGPPAVLVPPPLSDKLGYRR